MLDLTQYESLGAALTAALERWPSEVCLIEADRERERCRLTYRQFAEAALPLAAALEESGFAAGDRAAIIMTNQSKWLISAYAVFYCGGVLVPLDYKLSPREHLALLAHCKARVLVVEYPLWRAITQDEDFRAHRVENVLVTEAPPEADLSGAKRWEDFHSARTPEFRPRKRADTACIVYSSGTGGRPKGCVLTHDNYLEQCRSLTALYPFWPGVRYLSILPTNHAIDFMVGFIGPFVCGATVVHLRTLRPEFVREAFTLYHITYMSLVPLVLKNLEKGLRARFAELPRTKRAVFDALVALNRSLVKGLFSGSAGKYLLNEMAHGAVGTMPACEFVDVAAEIYELAAAGKMDEARALLEKLLPLIGMEESYGMSFAKTVLVRRGVFKTAKMRGVAGETMDSVDLQELDAWWKQLAPHFRA